MPLAVDAVYEAEISRRVPVPDGEEVNTERQNGPVSSPRASVSRRFSV
jgi:hypothetical protein